MRMYLSVIVKLEVHQNFVLNTITASNLLESNMADQFIMKKSKNHPTSYIL